MEEELFQASITGDEKKVNMLLLEKGANPNAKDINGVTPLTIAYNNDKVEIAQMLEDKIPITNQPINGGKNTRKRKNTRKKV